MDATMPVYLLFEQSTWAAGSDALVAAYTNLDVAFEKARQSADRYVVKVDGTRYTTPELPADDDEQ